MGIFTLIIYTELQRREEKPIDSLKTSHERVKRALEGLKEFEAEHKTSAIIQAKNKLRMISASLEDIHKERVEKRARTIVVKKEKIKQVKAKLRKISKDLEETQQEHAQLKRKKAQKPLEGKKEPESRYRIEESEILKVDNKLRKLTIEAEEIKKSRKLLKGLEETQQRHARIKWKKAQKPLEGKKEPELRYQIEELEILLTCVRTDRLADSSFLAKRGPAP